MASVPENTPVPPEKVLFPLSDSVPSPSMAIPPDPDNRPESLSVVLASG